MTNDIVQGAHLGDQRLFLCFESGWALARFHENV